jgi:hypothetical protein
MGILMFRCPETARGVPTGYDVDPARFRKMPVFFALSFCPTCRTNHEWFAADAWVEGEIAPRKLHPLRPSEHSLELGRGSFR